MTPAAYLAQLRSPAEGARPLSRGYAAVAQSATPETFVTFHKDGKFQAFPYASFAGIDGDEQGGTLLRISHPKLRIVMEGRQLGAVFEALRTRRAAHLFEWSGGRFDPPQPGEPVITRMAFGVERTTRETDAAA